MESSECLDQSLGEAAEPVARATVTVSRTLSNVPCVLHSSTVMAKSIRSRSRSSSGVFPGTLFPIVSRNNVRMKEAPSLTNT